MMIVVEFCLIAYYTMWYKPKNKVTTVKIVFLREKEKKTKNGKQTPAFVWEDGRFYFSYSFLYCKHSDSGANK